MNMWALFHLGSREWAVQSTFRSYIATINESEGQDKVMQTCDEPIKIGGGTYRLCAHVLDNPNHWKWIEKCIGQSKQTLLVIVRLGVLVFSRM